MLCSSLHYKFPNKSTSSVENIIISFFHYILSNSHTSRYNSIVILMRDIMCVEKGSNLYGDRTGWKMKSKRWHKVHTCMWSFDLSCTILSYKKEKNVYRVIIISLCQWGRQNILIFYKDVLLCLITYPWRIQLIQ